MRNYYSRSTVGIYAPNYPFQIRKSSHQEVSVVRAICRDSKASSRCHAIIDENVIISSQRNSIEPDLFASEQQRVIKDLKDMELK